MEIIKYIIMKLQGLMDVDVANPYKRRVLLETPTPPLAPHHSHHKTDHTVKHSHTHQHSRSH